MHDYEIEFLGVVVEFRICNEIRINQMKTDENDNLGTYMVFWTFIDHHYHIVCQVIGHFRLQIRVKATLEQFSKLNSRSFP